MAIKKAKPSKEVAQKSLPNPWRTWCNPTDVDNADRQYFLDNQEELLSSIKNFSPALLLDAAREITFAADEIVPGAPDIENHPVQALEILNICTDEIGLDGGRCLVPLKNILDENPFHCNLYKTLKWITAAWPLPEVVKQLKDLTPNMIRLLMAAQKLGRKKVELAETMKLKESSAKLTKAYKTFCMIELTGDIEKDAEQLFLEKRITPDDFRVAMRSAFKLDRDATKEINNKGCIESQSPQVITVSLPQQERELIQQSADNSAAAKDAAECAAARTLKELKEKSKGGRKGAMATKASRGKDTVRENILKEVKEKLSDWDKRYPNRHKSHRDIEHSDAAAFNIVANRHKDENGKPIMSVDAIKKAMQRRKKEKRGKYDRIGKERGCYISSFTRTCNKSGDGDKGKPLSPLFYARQHWLWCRDTEKSLKYLLKYPCFLNIR